jgi:hypothetical protein
MRNFRAAASPACPHDIFKKTAKKILEKIYFLFGNTA